MSLLSKRLEAYDKNLIQQGMQQGMQEGVQQGMQQGFSNTLLILLEDRFGRVPSSVTRRFKQASVDELMDLYRRALHIKSLQELFH